MLRSIRSRQYLWLAPLVLIVLLYQLLYCYEVFRVRKASSSLDLPIYTADGTISALTERAAKAGLHAGDKILSIGGTPIHGNRDFFAALHAESSQQPLVVTVQRPGATTPKTFEVPGLARKQLPLQFSEALVAGLLTLAMLFCALIGIYAALVLPNDIRALSFFGLMVGASQVVASAQPYDFPRALWFFAQLYRSEAILLWPLWMICFSLYFPARYAWEVKRPALKWLLFAPFLLRALLTTLILIGRFYDFQSLSGLLPIANAFAFSSGLWLALGVTFFFAAIGVKLGVTENRDARRRLRILFAGCTVSLTPLGLLVAYQAFVRQDSLHPTPNAILLPVCFLFCLFPVTFAYVIVADRAMDLRVAVRQGLRYTLAKAGMRVLISVAAAAFMLLASNLLFQSSVAKLGVSTTERLKFAVYIAVMIACIILVRRTRKRLGVWIDKRFFREAYNAQVVLEDLSSSVRSIVDERELLETVARRISETLHVPQFVFLLQSDGGFRPEYCLGVNPPHTTTIQENSTTVRTITAAKEPPPIYYDRQDNWVHSTPAAEVDVLKTLQAQLLLPLPARHNLIGIMSLGQKLSEEPYTRSDLQLLHSVATHTGMALENSRLTRVIASEIAQREKLNREIEIAREVQERLFPQRLPAILGVDYCGACRPALGVGGDYYDFLALPDGGLGVAIGDVSGKGIAAALLMASLQASLRGQALMGQGNLAQLMTNVNQLVFDATPDNRYATFFYGQLHPASGLFRYVNAGHNAPLILRSGHDSIRHSTLR